MTAGVAKTLICWPGGLLNLPAWAGVAVIVVAGVAVNLVAGVAGLKTFKLDYFYV